MCSADIFLGLLAILFPPLPVWVKRGICSADSLINILLCCLGYIPGTIHAWYIIAKYPEPGYDYEPLEQDAEGRVYVIVREGGRPHHTAQGQQQQPKPNKKPGQPNANMSYGTTGAPSAASAGQPQQDGGEGSSEGHPPPPSYAQVVAGDHKVQTQE
ncbi:UPF0057-domain-containing protein [Coniochaeta ligniaria NRRL 30616]|uniref:UPF0057-domain-containing protein n=1 Tax=Coniochaeta ligniaria NRRL 30616 TaxID=1408157 RepID=A0A1J7IN17_9PEZI|nr:UPF0057-domain-containing protein [Coniochaeta ligniaria NRRL 30616]